MLGKMLCRLARVVVVRRSMMIMMMTDAFQMIDLVCNVEHFPERESAALHRKSMLGK